MDKATQQILQLMRDVDIAPRIPEEDIRRAIEDILQAHVELQCDDCEWFNNCDNCDERMPDEPRWMP